ncbi:hypothetical protein [Frankia sp. QA3]|nr:hypothetical protein [Frankia sp. QA3]
MATLVAGWSSSVADVVAALIYLCSAEGGFVTGGYPLRAGG